MHESKSGGLCDRFDPKRRSVLAFLLLTGLSLSGCGPKVTPNVTVDVMDKTSKSDQDKIRGYLDAAGLKGPIVSIQNGGDSWLVDVGAETVPGKRGGGGVAPPTYQIDKATGKVTGQEGGGGAGGAGTN